jgi:hypothetical protein
MGATGAEVSLEAEFIKTHEGGKRKVQKVQKLQKDRMGVLFVKDHVILTALHALQEPLREWALAWVQGEGSSKVLRRTLFFRKFRPVVSLGFELDLNARACFLGSPNLFSLGPKFQPLVGIQAFFVHGLFAARLNGQFKTDAIGVKEVNALKDMVIGHAQHLNAMGLQPRFGALEFLDGVDPERNVIDPSWRVR